MKDNLQNIKSQLSYKYKMNIYQILLDSLINEKSSEMLQLVQRKTQRNIYMSYKEG